MFGDLMLSIIRLYRWVRFRHGHGVHSPFAFAFINDVVEEKNGYYAYKAINEHLSRVRLYSHYTKDFPLKYLLLLYRISNYFKPEKIIRLGAAGGESLLYLQALSSTTLCTLIDSDRSKIDVALSLIDTNPRIRVELAASGRLAETFGDLLASNGHTDLIVIHSSIENETKQIALEMCLKHQKERCLIVLEGLPKTRALKEIWSNLIKDTRVAVSFDLINWGIAIIDPELKKRDYKLFF